jgi:hypothetical protein
MSADETPSGKNSSAEDPTREALASLFVTSFVHNATTATAEWLEDGASAFEASLNKALAGTYTASDLAKDSAALWARTVKHALRMLPTPGPGEVVEETRSAAGGEGVEVAALRRRSVGA